MTKTDGVLAIEDLIFHPESISPEDRHLIASFQNYYISTLLESALDVTEKTGEWSVLGHLYQAIYDAIEPYNSHIYASVSKDGA